MSGVGITRRVLTITGNRGGAVVESGPTKANDDGDRQITSSGEAHRARSATSARPVGGGYVTAQGRCEDGREPVEGVPHFET